MSSRLALALAVWALLCAATIAAPTKCYWRLPPSEKATSGPTSGDSVCVSYCFPCESASDSDEGCTAKQKADKAKVSAQIALSKDTVTEFKKAYPYAKWNFRECDTNDCNKEDPCAVPGASSSAKRGLQAGGVVASLLACLVTLVSM